MNVTILPIRGLFAPVLDSKKIQPLDLLALHSLQQPAQLSWAANTSRDGDCRAYNSALFPVSVESIAAPQHWPPSSHWCPALASVRLRRINLHLCLSCWRLQAMQFVVFHSAQTSVLRCDQSGSTRALSMSKNSPSESATRPTTPGNVVVMSNTSLATTHLSWIASPTLDHPDSIQRPSRCGVIPRWKWCLCHIKPFVCSAAKNRNALHCCSAIWSRSALPR